MTDAEPLSPLTPPATATLSEMSCDPALAMAGDGAELRALEPGYATVLRIVYLLNIVPLVIGVCVADWLIMAKVDGPWGIASVVAIAIGLYVITVLPARQYRRWGYALGADSLRVVRGYVFHVDTVVPFVRVQHIDVGQGPIERMKGLSHLVVHTAGTHNSIVTLPGLLPDDAAAMRDTIRAHIISDFA